MYRIRRRMTSSSSHVVALGLALLGIGTLMVYSAGASLSSPQSMGAFYRNPGFRQMVFAAVGAAAMLGAMLFPYRRLRMGDKLLHSPGVWLLALSVGLLVAVLIPGIGGEINSARRWIRIRVGGWSVGMQPSEMAKFALVVFLAGALSWPRLNVRRFFRGLLPLAAVIGLVCGLIGKEDFGTMVLVGTVAGCMLLAGGARVWHLMVVALPALAGAAYLVVHEPYRMQRLTAFLNIYEDPQGAGYHPIQSLVSLTGGGWWGRGLGSSIQKYGYLPEAKTDFIFAVICEELGAVGGMVVIALFLLLLLQAAAIISRSRDSFGRLLSLGVALTVGLQAVMNIAVVTVSVPTKGISLPFVSAGGSGVVFAALGLGLLAGVARRREIVVDPDWIELGDEEGSASGAAVGGG